MTTSMTAADGATAATWSRVFAALIIISITVTHGEIVIQTCGGGGWRSHRPHASSGLIATMSGGLCRGVQGDAKVLLLHLLWKLVVVAVRRGVRHALHAKILHLLLRLEHANVDILLMGGSDLLLLLLQHLELLGQLKLLH